MNNEETRKLTLLGEVVTLEELKEMDDATKNVYLERVFTKAFDLSEERYNLMKQVNHLTSIVNYFTRPFNLENIDDLATECYDLNDKLDDSEELEDIKSDYNDLIDKISDISYDLDELHRNYSNKY